MAVVMAQSGRAGDRATEGSGSIRLRAQGAEDAQRLEPEHGDEPWDWVKDRSGLTWVKRREKVG